MRYYRVRIYEPNILCSVDAQIHALPVNYGGFSSLSLPSDVDYCSEAAKCCQLGVDEYGWIAAAVGWSLWFLTLILFCIDKLMKLQPDEPKPLEA